MRENEVHIRKGEGGKEGWRGSRKRDGEEDSGATEAEGIKGGGAVRRWEKWRETREIPLLPFDLLGCYSSERHSAGKGKTRGRHQWLRVEKSKEICIFFFVPISHLFLLGFLPVLTALCHALR